MAKYKKFLCTLALSLLLISSTPIATAAGDLYLSESNVYFSTSYFVENVPVMIYATAGNASGADLLGTIKFWNDTNGVQISSDQPISALAGSSDTVFVAWTPTPGTQQISITVYPWDLTGDDSSNNTIWRTVTVDYDTDGDGVGNNDDEDDDNDGYPDYEDDFPLDSSEWQDTDGDGTGDNADEDDDNDGTPDTEDQMPLDYEETLDTDGDGIGNNKDADDDGDGIADEIEEETDPLNDDSDGDGYSDSEDAFPMDSEEWSDYDNDGIGGNADLDDDNDGLPDDEDEYDENVGPTIDVDKGVFNMTGSVTTLDASDSYDKDGEVRSYEWSQEGEILSEEAVYETTYLESGKQVLELKITDNTGESRTQEIIVKIYSKSFLIFTGLLVLVLICLAFYIIYRYSPSAPQVEEKKEPKAKKKTPAKKTTKKPAKKTTKRKTTKKK